MLRGKQVGGGIPGGDCRDWVEEVGDAVGAHVCLPKASGRRWCIVLRHRHRRAVASSASRGNALWSSAHVRRVVELALLSKLAGARLHEKGAVRLPVANRRNAVRVAIVGDRGAGDVPDRTVDLPTLLCDGCFAVYRVVVPAKGGRGGAR